MNDPGNRPYERDRFVDKPGIIGARWWHASLADEGALIARRSAMRNILIAGSVIAGIGALLAVGISAAVSSDEPDIVDQRKTSLDMQKEYGWSFGAVGEPLVFDGVSQKPFEAGALSSLGTDLAPSRSDLLPYFQRALFESPDAVPKSLGKLDPSEAAGFKPLRSVVQPISTISMAIQFKRGKSFASLFASLAETGGTPGDAKTAVVVDLPGPEAVAFAAGAASVFDPVFLFDNWPHPRGVVRAHETLSAAAYYQPLFAKARSANATAKQPPMFILDRRRLFAYTSDATQFDNRYVAKLPTPAAAMKALGVNNVLYVVPAKSDTFRESDDLNDDFVSYKAAGMDVRSVSTDLFQADAADAGDPRPPVAGNQPPKAGAESDTLLSESDYYYYGGSRGSHHSFFVDYPWAKPARAASARPVNPGASFTPRARTTPYSSGTGTVTTTRSRPTNFGTVPVAVAVGTGVVLGARYSRSGSWNRAGSTGG